MPWAPSSLFNAGDVGGWFDASDLSTLFQDSAGATAVTADTQPVGKWLAKFGSGSKGFDLSQATSGAKPVYKTDGALHWLQFDGGDWLDSLVERFGDTGLFASASEQFTVAVAFNVGTQTGTLFGRAGATSTSKTLQVYFTASQTLAAVCRGGTATNYGSTASSPGVASFRWDGAVAKLRYKDGATTVSVGSAVEESGQRIVVGARTNGSGHLLGATSRLAQVFFIDRNLSDTELSYLLWHFAQKVSTTAGTEPPADAITVSGASIDGSDVVAGTASATVAITGAISEAADTVSAAFSSVIGVASAVLESGDLIAGSVDSTGLRSVAGAIQESDETVSAGVAPIVHGEVSLTEASDQAAGACSAVTALMGQVAEAEDAVIASLAGTTELFGAAQEVGDIIAGQAWYGQAGQTGYGTIQSSTTSAAITLTTPGTMVAVTASRATVEIEAA